MIRHTPSSSTSSRSRTSIATLVLATLLLLSAVVPAGAAVATAAPQEAPAALDGPPIAQADTQNNSTANTTDGPTTASQVRVTPDIPDADYVSATVIESDQQFNVSGTFVTFALSEPADAVRVKQPGAQAQVLAGGQVVRVDFARDAAPGDSASLYTLELFFADSSTKAVDVYARNTDVTASPAVNPEYQSVISYLQSQADDMGYEQDPEGIQSYIENREERAELLEGLWSEQIKQFISLRIAQLFSPLDWVALFLILGLFAVWMNKKHGWLLRAQQVAIPRKNIVREAVRQEANKNRNAAAKHALGDVEGIGTNAERYWNTLGVETVENVVQIACKGIVATDDEGNILQEDGNDVLVHQGIDDIASVEPLTERAIREQTWLQPVVLEGRLRPVTALSHIEEALRVAETQYNRGPLVRQTRRQVQELQKKLRGEKGGEEARSSTSGVMELPSGDRDRDPDPSGAIPGGDD